MSRIDPVAGEIIAMAEAGYGWEDIMVSLGKRGLVTFRDQAAVRRFVLAQSRVRHAS